MEKLEHAKPYASSPAASASLAAPVSNSSSAAPSAADADAGGPAASRQLRLDYVLSLLHSNIAEFKQSGGRVKLQQSSEGTQITLVGVGACLSCGNLFSGQKCPTC